MDDSSIIELYFKRDQEAVTKTKQQYGKLIAKLTANILRSKEDAEEAENDTYLSLWSSIPPQKPQSLCAYACRTAKNTALNKVRYNNAFKRDSSYDVCFDELENSLFSSSCIDSELNAKELSSQINDFLSRLDSEQRKIFVRRYWFGDSITDISLQTGMSESKIKSMLFRQRAKLREKLEKEGTTV